MSIKILLADDSITIQKVIGIIFGADEYALTVVDNGKDALEKAREIVPDVLLIDAVMPGMTGYEVCEILRTIPALAAKPILLLTGSFEPFDENKAKSCGADDFLAKPFESQQIVSKVKALFELGVSRAPVAEMFQPPQAAQAFQAPTEPPPPETTAAPSPTAAVIDSVEPGDIWEAFLPDAGSATSAVAEAPSAEQGNAFATFGDEPEPVVARQQQHIGSQWVPVEEQTFEFVPEAPDETPSAPFPEPSFSERELTFDDSSVAESTFQAEPAQTATLVTPVGEPIAPPPIPVAEAGTPEIALSEEQLRAAVMSASREVIERIVWEIVPDLAEAMIRDAILKIREGR